MYTHTTDLHDLTHPIVVLNLTSLPLKLRVPQALIGVLANHNICLKLHGLPNRPKLLDRHRMLIMVPQHHPKITTIMILAEIRERVLLRIRPSMCTHVHIGRTHQVL